MFPLDVSDPRLKGQRLARDRLIKDVIVALSTDIVIVVSALTLVSNNNNNVTERLALFEHTSDGLTKS